MALVIAVVAGIAASAAIIIAIQQVDAQATTLTRRVSGSWIQTSSPHSAEGHNTHQVVNFFVPQPDAIYNGKVTFTSSKGIDIIAYYDITGQNSTGVKTWKVGDNTYAVTTLMTNVTSGSVEFAGSGLLAHSAASDSYTVAYSAYGWAYRNTPMVESP